MKLSRRLIPDVTTLQAFECAARHGSFTQAAHELNLTQSAVSRQIKDLEEQLGVLLFERVRQRVVLSDDGRRFLPEVRKLLHQTEETMLRAMASASSEHSLAIATLPTFGSRWLTPRIPGFLAENPGTIINIASRSAPFDFDEENFDLAMLIVRNLVKRLREADRKIESLALIDVYGRVARLLLDMAHNVDGKWVVEHAPPKQEIARMIGASREMVSRVVKDLQRKGLIRAEKRKIFVLDKQSMQRRASTRHHSPREPQT